MEQKKITVGKGEREGFDTIATLFAHLSLDSSSHCFWFWQLSFDVSKAKRKTKRRSANGFKQKELVGKVIVVKTKASGVAKSSSSQFELGDSKCREECRRAELNSSERCRRVEHRRALSKVCLFQLKLKLKLKLVRE